MPKINSKQKGSRGERELSKELSRILGCSARRGQQYCGASGDADVIIDLPIHIECKRTETLQLYKALEQAKNDAKDKLPIVCHRKNNKPWICILQLDDLPQLVEIIHNYIKTK